MISTVDNLCVLFNCKKDKQNSLKNEINLFLKAVN